MNPKADGRERTESDKQPDEEPTEREWKPPQKSDQAPGEEAVQVNDVYVGDAPPPSEDSADDQHPTGG
jgi:hypothetical protein